MNNDAVYSAKAQDSTDIAIHNLPCALDERLILFIEVIVFDF